MTRYRIFVGELPRMMRAIVEDAVSGQPDMDLVERGPADVAIVPETARALPTVEALLRGDGRLRVLALSADGRRARILHISARPVPTVSPLGLMDAIRAAMADRPH